MRYLCPNDHLLFDSKAVKQQCAECERVAAPPEPMKETDWNRIFADRRKWYIEWSATQGYPNPGTEMIDNALCLMAAFNPALQAKLGTLEQALRETAVDHIHNGQYGNYYECRLCFQQAPYEQEIKHTCVLGTGVSGESRQ